MQRLACLLTLLSALVVGACATNNPAGPPRAGNGAAAELATAIRALGPGVDPEEAERAARIAYAETQRLALAYQITDPPLVHNTKVNLGLKPRGLCWHWAVDLGARLAQENFRTLDLHQAIANADNPFRLEHSTLIVSRRGDGFRDGLVLDPWRKGGVLHWTPTRADTRFDWKSRDAVFARQNRHPSRTRISGSRPPPRLGARGAPGTHRTGARRTAASPARLSGRPAPELRRSCRRSSGAA